MGASAPGDAAMIETLRTLMSRNTPDEDRTPETEPDVDAAPEDEADPDPEPWGHTVEGSALHGHPEEEALRDALQATAEWLREREGGADPETLYEQFAGEYAGVWKYSTRQRFVEKWLPVLRKHPDLIADPAGLWSIDADAALDDVALEAELRDRYSGDRSVRRDELAIPYRALRDEGPLTARQVRASLRGRLAVDFDKWIKPEKPTPRATGGSGFISLRELEHREEYDRGGELGRRFEEYAALPGVEPPEPGVPAFRLEPDDAADEAAETDAVAEGDPDADGEAGPKYSANVVDDGPGGDWTDANAGGDRDD